ISGSGSGGGGSGIDGVPLSLLEAVLQLLANLCAGSAEAKRALVASSGEAAAGRNAAAGDDGRGAGAVGRSDGSHDDMLSTYSDLLESAAPARFGRNEGGGGGVGVGGSGGGGGWHRGSQSLLHRVIGLALTGGSRRAVADA
ncbi:unnamed protein product, partial [Phaeothamnion confervicola]